MDKVVVSMIVLSKGPVTVSLKNYIETESLCISIGSKNREEGVGYLLKMLRDLVINPCEDAGGSKFINEAHRDINNVIKALCSELDEEFEMSMGSALDITVLSKRIN